MRSQWSCVLLLLLLFFRNCRYSQYNLNCIIIKKKIISLPLQFSATSVTTVEVTNDTVTISVTGLTTVQLKDADPNELQLFIDKMPAFVKGKNVKYSSSKLSLVLVLKWKGTWLNLCTYVWKQADQDWYGESSFSYFGFGGIRLNLLGVRRFRNSLDIV